MTPAKSVSFTIAVDGTDYLLTFPLEVRHSMKLRSATGWSQMEFMKFFENPDIDLVAVGVWLAQIQAGTFIDFDVVADKITYASKLDIKFGGDDDHPES